MSKIWIKTKHRADLASPPARGLSRWLAAGIGAVSLLGGSATAAPLFSLGWESACGRDTCFNDKGFYALTFSASKFSGPVDISRLLLDRIVLGSMDHQFFKLAFVLNGKTIADWGDWYMGEVPGEHLSLWGPDLLWNPADGDLVLTLELVAPNGERLIPDGAGGWFFDDGGWPGSPPPVHGRSGHSGSVGSSDGDVFSPAPPPPGGNGDSPTPPDNSPPPPTNSGPPTLLPPTGPDPVPEPATWALLIGGFGLAGAALRRRRAIATISGRLSRHP